LHYEAKKHKHQIATSQLQLPISVSFYWHIFKLLQVTIGPRDCYSSIINDYIILSAGNDLKLFDLKSQFNITMVNV